VNIKEDTLVFLQKYSIKNFIVMNEDEKIEMDVSNLLSLEYICDYENAIFAIMKAVLRVDIRKRIYILKHKRKIRVKLEIEKAGLDIQTEEFVTNPEPVLNETFAIYLNDDDEIQDQENLDERLEANFSEYDESENPLEVENYFETQNTIELYLFNPKLLEASRYSFNEIYTKGTLQNIVGNILTICHIGHTLSCQATYIENASKS